MIYGINFGATPLSEYPRIRAVPQTIKVEKHPYRLIGIATTAAEKDAMLVQADNGRRTLHVVSRNAPRYATEKTVYAIYTRC